MLTHHRCRVGCGLRDLRHRRLSQAVALRGSSNGFHGVWNAGADDGFGCRAINGNRGQVVVLRRGDRWGRVPGWRRRFSSGGGEGFVVVEEGLGGGQLVPGGAAGIGEGRGGWRDEGLAEG